ncbi:hypothetical protein BDA96_04G261400 [Sorghum bicolor]|jgi:hypothetical protein|uniref:Uncharacterized protein n=2 Tax=Sorghum bicolor TaxID=4558 RepID=A0A921UJC3_SORBI|nr:hypothetical protein BDA96_04G261400 [Sorghum bicolor]KXG30800.1 hypothetical protein SORBI_3004G245500 [Sorghum bicolor]
MAMMTRFVFRLMIVVLVMLLASPAGSSARRLEGDTWAGEAASGDHPVIQSIKHLYLQQLKGSGAGPSCGSFNPQTPPCPHHG